MATIFSRIISGEIPSYKIYEDEHTYAFLDINPVQQGHTLIVPKVEVDYFIDVPEPFYTSVFQAAKRIGPAIQQATNCQRIGTMIMGFDVPHFHYHLIPLTSIEDLYAPSKPATSEQLTAVHEAILKFL